MGITVKAITPEPHKVGVRYMSKKQKVEAVTLAGDMVATEQVVGPIVTLKQHSGAQKLRGARAAWYAVLTECDGKPASEFLVRCIKNPPSLPTKGKSAGVAEKPTGWLSWFVRNGYATLSN